MLAAIESGISYYYFLFCFIFIYFHLFHLQSCWLASKVAFCKKFQSRWINVHFLENCPRISFRENKEEENIWLENASLFEEKGQTGFYHSWYKPHVYPYLIFSKLKWQLLFHFSLNVAQFGLWLKTRVNGGHLTLKSHPLSCRKRFPVEGLRNYPKTVKTFGPQNYYQHKFS